VTFHGFALNVSVDLAYFSLIRPCGLDSDVITSMDQLLGRTPEFAQVKAAICRQLAEVFQMRLVPTPAAELLAQPAHAVVH
jgi:lipoate-protein ligase B